MRPDALTADEREELCQLRQSNDARIADRAAAGVQSLGAEAGYLGRLSVAFYEHALTGMPGGVDVLERARLEHQRDLAAQLDVTEEQFVTMRRAMSGLEVPGGPGAFAPART